MGALAHCVSNKISIVIASTGLTANQIESIHRAAQVIPVCYAPNMSVAVNLTMKLVEYAARALKDAPGDADVEIIERHHRFKEDSPSGTALKFGQIAAKEMGISEHVHGRVGQVGSVRTVKLGTTQCVLGMMPDSIRHLWDDGGNHRTKVAASNRDCYASGAIAAAKYIVGKPAKLFSMMDVLNLGSSV